MKKATNYLVSVFIDEKCVDLFFSEDLCELKICRLLHKGCDIDVFDLRSFSRLPSDRVRMTEMATTPYSSALPEQIVCVETKKVYSSLSACAVEIGALRHNLLNALENSVPIDGKHFMFTKDLFNRETSIRNEKKKH